MRTKREIDLAKSRAVATIDGQVQSAQAFIAQMTKRRAELESQKRHVTRRDPVPGAIEREIETIDAELARQNELIAGKKKEAATRRRALRRGQAALPRAAQRPAAGAVVTTGDGRHSPGQPVGIELTSTR